MKFADRLELGQTMALLVACPLLACLVAVTILADKSRREAAGFENDLTETEEFANFRRMQLGFEIEWGYSDQVFDARAEIDGSEDLTPPTLAVEAMATPTIRRFTRESFDRTDVESLSAEHRELHDEALELIDQLRPIVDAGDEGQWKVIRPEILDLSQRMAATVDELLRVGGADRLLLYDQSSYNQLSVVEATSLFALSQTADPRFTDAYADALLHGAESDRTFGRIVRSNSPAVANQLLEAREASGLFTFRALTVDPTRTEPVPINAVLEFTSGSIEFSDTMDVINEVYYANLLADYEDQRQGATRRAWMYAFLAVALTVFSVGSVVLVGRRTTTRMQALAATARRMSGGHFDTPKPLTKAADSISVLDRLLYDLSRSIDLGQQQVLALIDGDYDAEVLQTKLPGAVGQHLQQALQSLSANAAELDHRARHDPLTGLFDRHGLEQALDRPADSWTVIAIDLDGFKEINDQHGHAAGDAILRQAAESIKALTRADDAVARTGGDEFVVCLHNAIPRAELAVIDRLGPSVETPLEWEGHQLQVTASIGWCRAEGNMSISEALGRADDAMYQAKRLGKRRVVAA